MINKKKVNKKEARHCEEHRAEAIQKDSEHWIASPDGFAMTTTFRLSTFRLILIIAFILEAQKKKI
jgi:hypothetical protein